MDSEQLKELIQGVYDDYDFAEFNLHFVNVVEPGKVYEIKNNRINNKLKDTRHRLDVYIEKLNGLSPLNKLKSGYSLVTSEDKIVNSTKNVNIGENINISLIDGDIVAKVEDIIYNNRG